jgi:hypothetical protein
MQWELYCGVNTNNAAIQNQYQKTMLFLTYVKGDLVRTWVLAASRWLGQEVAVYHVDQYDPYLWESIEGAFRRQFANTLEKEQAQNKLRQGIHMKDGKIDEYVAEFDTLVTQAGYKADDAQMLEKFISGLPASLYETIYQLDDPKMYEAWRRAAIKRQEKWLHMQSIKQGRRMLDSFRQASGSRNINLNWFLAPPSRDPNAMDTSARTRVQGHLSLTDDPPEYKEDTKPPFQPREGYHCAQQEHRGGGNLSKVKCYNCDKMGHFARDCRAPQREQQWRSERRQGQSWGRQARDEEERELSEPEPRDKADSWLRAIAEEDDKVKNMILRDLVGKNKDFLNA